MPAQLLLDFPGRLCPIKLVTGLFVLFHVPTNDFTAFHTVNNIYIYARVQCLSFINTSRDTLLVCEELCLTGCTAMLFGRRVPVCCLYLLWERACHEN